QRMLESGRRRGSHRTHGPVQPVSPSRRATGASHQREIRCGTPSMEDRRERAGRRAMKRLVLESTAPFQGLPELVAYDEGLFENRTVGVPFYFGTHYLALHLLEGFVPREAIRVCHAPNGSRHRLASLRRGEIEATTLTEPYITLAEKQGCRTICSGFFHGTE